jgi:hypothetical protein
VECDVNWVEIAVIGLVVCEMNTKRQGGLLCDLLWPYERRHEFARAEVMVI